MTTFVLDASALIRYVDDEAGADRVEEILSACAALQAGICISAVQWGEAAGNFRKRFGAVREAHILSNVLPSQAVIVPVSASRAVRAAALRVDHAISYADAFAVELAMESTNHVLLTADFGLKSVDDLARLEFLPAK